MCSLGFSGDGKMELPPLCRKICQEKAGMRDECPSPVQEAPEKQMQGLVLIKMPPSPREKRQFLSAKDRRQQQHQLHNAKGAAKMRPSPSQARSEDDGRETPELMQVTPDVTPSGRPEPPEFPPGIFNQIPLGTFVEIQGLVRAPAFNGRVGTVHSIDANTSRYDVLLTSPSGEQQWTKVRYSNLRPVPSGSLRETPVTTEV